MPPADPAVLRMPLAWAHSSDLPDPTPWLEPGQLLLTDGMHFLERTDAGFARDYVDRLVAARVVALGFATRILHDRLPAALVDACRDAGLPLIEVADRAPFMAIIRHVADAREAEQRQRLERSLEAHRAVARAALQPNGLEAILGELERRLRTWVVLFDAAGAVLHASATTPMPVAAAGDVEAAVAQALARGLRASVRHEPPEPAFTLQTIGRRGALRAALVVGTGAPLDGAGAELLTSVIALASIALEQTSALTGATEALRRALLELLLAGELAVARRTADRLEVPVPGEGPLRVLLAAEAGFSASRDGALVVLVADDGAAAAVAALAASGRSVAVSAPTSWADVAAALRQAEWLRATDQPAGTVVRFDDARTTGMLGVLRRHDGDLLATALLAPAAASEDGRRLLECARVWLDHNGAFDPAARALGIHRHTLRGRVESLGRLLGLDLERFGDRAELFQALRLTGGP